MSLLLYIYIGKQEGYLKTIVIEKNPLITSAVAVHFHKCHTSMRHTSSYLWRYSITWLKVFTHHLVEDVHMTLGW